MQVLWEYNYQDSQEEECRAVVSLEWLRMVLLQMLLPYPDEKAKQNKAKELQDQIACLHVPIVGVRYQTR